MRKIIFIILIIAVAALFVAPESVIGDYKGLISLRSFIRDFSVKAKNIILDLAREGESEDLKNIGNDAKKSIENKIDEGVESVIPDELNINIGE